MRWTTRAGPIVVGVDGTDASIAALAFAVDEARVRGTTVEVVTAWSPSATGEPGSAGADAHWFAQDVQDRAVAGVLAAATNPPVIARVVSEDDPVSTLLDYSRGASLLVLGRGRRGTSRPEVVGSVSETLVRRAACPVTVVPPRLGSADDVEPEVLPVAVT